MPKEPETIDRMLIVAEAPSLEMVGAGLAALTKLGFTNVNFKVVTDVLKYKSRTVHEVTANEFAAEFVKQNARFKLPDLTAAFKAAGRAPTNAYDAVKKLVKARVVAKNGEEYVRVEALPAPKKAAKPAKPAKAAKPKRGQHGPYEVSNRVLIERAIRGRKHISVVELREVFAGEKRPEKSISPLLTKLVQEKRIKPTGTGTYDVVQKKPKKSAAAVVTNGSGAEAHV